MKQEFSSADAVRKQSSRSAPIRVDGRQAKKEEAANLRKRLLELIVENERARRKLPPATPVN